MNSNRITPTLRFTREFSDQELFEAQSRGYLSHVMARLGENRLYPLFFYDPVRLQQDLEESSKQGRLFVADPGMIVVPEITLEVIKEAVEQLCREGFFDHLVPLTEDDLSSGDPYQWPPQRRQDPPAKTAKVGRRSGKSVENRS
jgi:hypothetical protein